jgi:GDP-D-mannose dehydratase
MGKKALITGINGQDGSYLAELLLEKGYSFDRDLSFTLYQGAAHTEAAWATQAADSLRFWITKSL